MRCSASIENDHGNTVPVTIKTILSIEYSFSSTKLSVLGTINYNIFVLFIYLFVSCLVSVII